MYQKNIKIEVLTNIKFDLTGFIFKKKKNVGSGIKNLQINYSSMKL